MTEYSWRCRCGTPMRLGRIRCPACHAQHVFDTEMGHLRLAQAKDLEHYCINRPGKKLGCNWLTDVPNSMCYGCSLTLTTPLLGISANLRAFQRFEEAKRRLIAALMRMKLLPLYEYTTLGSPLRFHLKQDRRDNPYLADEYVMTGHSNGNITLNVRETDQRHIEITRRDFHEKYRTMLGTLRHEVGHYFFFVLVTQEAERLARFRALFGDEQVNYEEALKNYYLPENKKMRQKKKSPNHISEYARAHPFEDWAETWAHYMHMEDALAVSHTIGMDDDYAAADADEFTLIVKRWKRLTATVNAFNLSLGHKPSYPFLLTDHVIAKIRFVADVIKQSGGSPYAYED